jgi:hypothetical protein
MDTDIKESIETLGMILERIEEKINMLGDEVVEIKDEIPANLDEDLEEIKSLLIQIA